MKLRPIIGVCVSEQSYGGWSKPWWQQEALDVILRVI